MQKDANFPPLFTSTEAGVSLMKQHFETLKDRPYLSVALTRDSVCAGDDIDAPHEKTITIRSFTDPKTFAREAAAGYLPNVAGHGHVWVCVLNDQEVAEIRNDGVQSKVTEAKFSEENLVHFKYVSAPY